MKRFFPAFFAVIFCTIGLAACGCGHTWQDATCETPKTCTQCGVEVGEALGHVWTDATCEAAKLCTQCGATEGEALGHSWQDATCEAPKKCAFCGTEDGEALGHQPAMAVFSQIDLITGTGSGTVRCESCGTILESGEMPLTSLHDGSRFLCDPLAFFERFTDIAEGETPLDAMLTEDSTGTYVAQSYTASGYDLPLYVSRYVFYNGSTPVTTRDDDQRFSSITVYLGLNGPPIAAIDSVQLPATLWAVLSTCDPALTPEEWQAAVDSLFQNDTHTQNGLTYTLFFNEDNVLTLTVQVSGAA